MREEARFRHQHRSLRLRTERKRRGWSQTFVTALTLIAQSDLSLVERGLRPAPPLWRRRLSQAFGIPEKELFAPTEEYVDR